MYYDRQNILAAEKQHLKSVRKYYLSIADVNIALANVHKNLYRHIDLTKYQYATEYIHQYISHTTIWNLKFAANLESPEVALLQIFHLDYIFSQEPTDYFLEERVILQQQRDTFYALQPFPQEHMGKRHEKMLEFIDTQSNKEI